MNKKKLTLSNRKIVILTIAAGLITPSLFASIFAASYIFVPKFYSSINNVKNGRNMPYISSSQHNNSLTYSSTQGRSNPVQISHSCSTNGFYEWQVFEFFSCEIPEKGLLTHFENGDGIILNKHDRTAWLAKTGATNIRRT